MSEEKSDSQETTPVDEPAKENEIVTEKKQRDPVKLWTGVIFAVCAALFVWHLLSDKYTPYTSNGRIEAFIVPIAPQVSGILTRVNVTNNQVVVGDQDLALIDPGRYELAVRRAGGQVNIIIYTGNNLILNSLGGLWIRTVSVFSHIY